VWEPILPTDWGKPGSSALRRLGDNRVRQFWDSDHKIAALIKRSEATGKLRPNCCERKGLLWDLIAAYAPGAQWRDILPEPIFLDGPVVKVAADFSSAMVDTKKTP
jgi:hypothetical protein